MSYSLVQSMPAWILNSFKDKKCTKCNHFIIAEDVIGIGIRKYNKDYSIFLEIFCSHCEYRELAKVRRNKINTVENLCFLIISELQKKKRIEKVQIRSKYNKNPIKPQKYTNTSSNKITDKEVENLKKFMKTSQSHDDFMKYIGVPKIKKNDFKNPDNN